jgi:hypothetical protein
MAAAAALIGRSAPLLGDRDKRLPRLLLDLGIALEKSGHRDEAVAVLDRVSALTGVDLEAIGAIARLELAFIEADRGRVDNRTLLDTSRRALEILEREGDPALVARGLTWLARTLLWAQSPAAAATEARRALDAAREAGDAATEAEAVEWYTMALVLGPTPSDEVLRVTEALLAEYVGRPSFEWLLRLTRGETLAGQGRIEEGRREGAAARALAKSLGLTLGAVMTSLQLGEMEMNAGYPELAVAIFESGEEELRRLEYPLFTATLANYRALALAELGREDEVEQIVSWTREVLMPDDIDDQVVWRVALTTVLARRGDGEALGLAEDAVNLSERSGAPRQRIRSLSALADARAALGLPDADGPLREALAAAEAKGLTVVADRLRSRLEATAAG